MNDAVGGYGFWGRGHILWRFGLWRRVGLRGIVYGGMLAGCAWWDGEEFIES